MDLWERLETIILVGEAAAYASALRKKAEETTGDTRSISHMQPCRIYNTEAGKRALLSTLLRHLAKRHLRLAIRLRRHHRVNVWDLFPRPGYRSRLALQYAVGGQNHLLTRSPSDLHYKALTIKAE
jgi:hypothetical protein